MESFPHFWERIPGGYRGQGGWQSILSSGFYATKSGITKEDSLQKIFFQLGKINPYLSLKETEKKFIFPHSERAEIRDREKTLSAKGIVAERKEGEGIDRSTGRE